MGSEQDGLNLDGWVQIVVGCWMDSEQVGWVQGGEWVLNKLEQVGRVQVVVGCWIYPEQVVVGRWMGYE